MGEDLVAAVGAGGEHGGRMRACATAWATTVAPRLGPVVAEQVVVGLMDGGDAVRREHLDERVRSGADRERLHGASVCAARRVAAVTRFECGRRDRAAVVLDDDEDHLQHPERFEQVDDRRDGIDARSEHDGLRRLLGRRAQPDHLLAAGLRRRGHVRDLRPSSTPAGPSSSGSGAG